MTLEEFIFENELVIESVEVESIDGKKYFVMDDGELVPVLDEIKG